MKSKVFLIIGSLLICISFIFLLIDIIIEYNAGKKSMEVLNIINEKTNTMENISNVNEMQTINIDGYDYIGTISIPSLNLNLPIISFTLFENPFKYSSKFDFIFSLSSNSFFHVKSLTL